MSFKGNLQSLGLFDVLQNVAQNCLTGTLKVSTKDRNRWVYFERGKVRLVSCGERVGLPMREFLVQRGYVTAKAMEKAVKSRGRSRALLHDILVKAGDIKSEDFIAAYNERIEEFLYELLEIKAAEYEFTDGAVPKGIFDQAQKSLSLGLEIQPMLVEGARRDDEWSRIKNVVQSGNEIFAPLGDHGPDENEVDEILVELWDHLDGRTEVGELEHKLPYGRFEIHNAIHSLVGLGFARPVTGSELSELALEEMHNGDKAKGRTLLEHALALERNNLELRRMLAELLEELGDRKEAAVCWAVIGYQENVAGHETEALAAYERAAGLDPTDVGLLERHHEIVGRCGDTAQFEAATLQLSSRLLEHGLMERAIDAVNRGMDRPDLADRPALLQHLLEIYQRAGRPEEGLELLCSSASKAERLGDRERAIAILEIGVDAMPDQAELVARLEDVMTSRRMRKRRFMRRLAVVVTTLFILATAGLLTVEEVQIQTAISGAVKDLPMSIFEDRARDNLVTLKGVLDAHWLAPSLGNVQALVDGLATVEVERIRIAAQAYRFVEALDRIRQVSSILGDHPLVAEIEQLRTRCIRGRDFMARFKGWLTSSEPNEPTNPDAFLFERTDVRGVIEMYHTLKPEAQGKVRQRLAALETVETLPFFTSLYLTGKNEESEKFGTDGKLLLIEVVKKLAKRAMELHEQLVRSGSKLAGESEAAKAWDLVVAAFFADKDSKIFEQKTGKAMTPEVAAELRRRAQHLAAFFVYPLPNPWPEDPEAMRQLIQH